MCGFDVGCHLWHFIAPFWTFIFWTFWALVALVILGILAQAKAVGGWPAVWGLVTGGLVFWTWWRTRQGKGLIPFPSDDPDAPEGTTRVPTRPVGPKVSKKRGGNIYEIDPYTGEGSWRQR